ncbi:MULTISPECIES: MucR family transcriptional regulator [unclassified Novosphingobium]|uniref:MucR family transcriptional regulator n=1 Tax=unclassified Novosphingobium TaxID=2644732 RepID=UPI0014943F50|nr:MULTISPECIES: MucR family transcriptional regulator [unclassified Novosphingobium]MBB3357036.1 putative transcriptional regulator [Novosphingobium sp. BK256]MBB3373437.1 putative transcriptional regulator [Novosphingobium sp. BK280]MBB3377806.1 putative transcriptional regulator [Novosphingobium sp. BK258]MBB3418783.1 putative transcriptional regulator [Novosphingobium sp. BK267]MBB3450382.1 putative transcriptional regulator [Novosphingobium sp. BK352]
MAEADNSGVMSLTVTLLSAYFANNTVPSSELPALVEGTRRALLGDASGAPGKSADDNGGVASSTEPAVEVEPEAPEAKPNAPGYKPAVSIEESLASPDQILSLIDGKPYKALKRHLSTHGLTPADYRARYGLPADYPLVAPSYSAARREVAQKFGLGGKRKSAPAAAAEEAPATPPTETVEPPAAEATPTKPAAARRARTKAVTAEPKPVAKAPKSTTSKSAKPIRGGKPTKVTKTSKAPKAAVDTTPAASADAAPKPKRSRAPKASAGTPASAELAPDAAAPAE